VLPGLYRIPCYYGPILVHDGVSHRRRRRAPLVDPGIPKKDRAVLELIAALHRQVADVKHILITHHHYDHTGKPREVLRANRGDGVRAPARRASDLRSARSPRTTTRCQRAWPSSRGSRSRSSLTA